MSQELPPEVREKISAAILQLAQAYWQLMDIAYKASQLTPPLKLTTLVKDETGMGRDTQVKIELERMSLGGMPARKL